MKTSKTYRALLTFLLNDDDFKAIPGHTKQSLTNFIRYLFNDSRIDFYILDKAYLDIAWLRLNDTYYNLDDLYLDYKNNITL